MGLRRVPRHSERCSTLSASTESLRRSAINSAASFDSAFSSSVVNGRMYPKPLQMEHQPCGELKENRRGSSSSNESPQCGQVISLLKTIRSCEGFEFRPPSLNEGYLVFFLPGKRKADPFPIFNAVFTNRCNSLSSVFSNSATTTSMVCSR